MTALDLPTRESFDGILQPLLGDGDGTGVAEAARLLGEIDVGSLTSELTDLLDSTLLDLLPIGDGVGVTGDLVGRFRTAVEAIPSDPEDLVSPLTGRLSGIQTQVTSALSTELEGSLSGLGELRVVLSADSDALLEQLNPAIDSIKTSLISGPFARLRSWSEQVIPFAAEIEAIPTAASASLQDRLIEWVESKIAQLLESILPPGGTEAEAIRSALARIADDDPAAAVSAAASSLERAYADLASRFGAGDFSALGLLSQAEGRFGAVVRELEQASGTVSSALDRAGDLSRATSDLSRRISNVADFEVVDLGSLRDGFAEAIAGVQKEVERIDLDAVADTIRAPLEELSATIRELGLDDLRERIGAVGGQLDDLADGLEAGLFEIVASVRSALAAARDTLREVAESIGSFESDGTFRFEVEAEIRGFLESVQEALSETVLPTIAEFRARIGDTLARVQAALETVRGQIESVRGELESALQGAADRIDALDVERRVEEIAARLRQMLDDLGVVDFNVAIDPVIAQLGEMKGSLSEIDVSELNEILRGALKLSLDVVIEIDFTSDITDVLLARIDEILEHPHRALEQVETTLEETLSQLGALAPAELLAPLDEVFEPVRDGLDELQLDALAEPLEEWHQAAAGRLAEVSPSALLQPLVELHRELVATFERAEPSALVQPLRTTIDDLVAELRAIDVTGLAGEVRDRIADAEGALDQLSPERLLDPASEAFSKIVAALDSFDPATLLEPFARVFAQIESALDGLSDDHARLLGRALEPLRTIGDRLDPAPVYQAIREASRGALGALDRLAPGQLLARLQAAYRDLLAAVDLSSAPEEISTRLAALNPVRHEGLGRAVSGLASARARLERDLASAEPPRDLVDTYAGISERIRSLVPTWVEPGMTADSVRRAVRSANPLSIETEVRELWNAVKERVRAVDPAHLGEPLLATFEEARATLAALDPDAILEIGQGTVDRIITQIEGIDLGFVTTELEGASQDVLAVVEALDPSPVIAQLDDIASALTDAIASLSPRELLSELDGPFEAAKAVVEAFDPASLREPLELVFERIQAVIEAVDVGVLLAPLVEKLEQLRNNLEAGLRRTDGALKEMLAAIPL